MNNDFSNLGKQIEDAVQSAINSGDFSALNRNIKSSVNSVVGATLDHTKNAVDSINKTVNGIGNNPQNRSNWSGQQPNQNQSQNQNQYQNQHQNQTKKTNHSQNPYNQQSWDNIPRYNYNGQNSSVMTKKTGGRMFLSVLALVFFYSNAVTFGFSTLGAILTPTNFMSFQNILALIISASLFCISSIAIIIFTCYYKKIARYKKYGNMLSMKEFWKIEELAASLNIPAKTTTREITKLIATNHFRDCYLDDEKTCVLVGKEMHEKYKVSQASYEQRKAQEEKDATLDPIIVEGREYVKKIRAANDLLPDEIISNKLYTLENVIAKIFAYVEQRPQKLSQIRKFMDYYLPTTMKLVYSYCEFEAQPVQGDTIKSSKQEILDILDTINEAFTTLLDELYKDDAIDISSDISVLKTMLKQEGLTQDDFN